MKCSNWRCHDDNSKKQKQPVTHLKGIDMDETIEHMTFLKHIRINLIFQRVFLLSPPNRWRNQLKTSSISSITFKYYMHAHNVLYIELLFLCY